MSTSKSNNGDKTRPHLGGFSKPRYTSVPDELFDKHLAVLTGYEVKVVLYIIRRTLGFKKDSDAISLSQICSGITKRDGEVLDKGTGLTRRQAVEAIKGLVDLGLINAERQYSAERGFEATIYALNFLDNDSRDTLVRPGNQGSSPSGLGLVSPEEQGLVRQGNQQETLKQETEGQETEKNLEYSNIRNVSPARITGNREPDEGTAGGPPASIARGGGQPEAIGQIINQRQGRSRPRPETETEEWQAIQAYIMDLSRLLGDAAPAKSSVTRAYNLFLAAGVPLDVFLNKLYQARSLTQESSARITNTDVDPEFKVKRKTKMAYFFAVLEDQLGLARPGQTRRSHRTEGTRPDGGQVTSQRPHSESARPSTEQPDQPPEGTRPRDSDGPYGPYIQH